MSDLQAKFENWANTMGYYDLSKYPNPDNHANPYKIEETYKAYDCFLAGFAIGNIFKVIRT